MMTDIIKRLQYEIDSHEISPRVYILIEDAIDELESLQKQLKDALQNAEYAWKNTNLIEKDRQRLMKENDTLKELVNYLDIL